MEGNNSTDIKNREKPVSYLFVMPWYDLYLVISIYLNDHFT